MLPDTCRIASYSSLLRVPRLWDACSPWVSANSSSGESTSRCRPAIAKYRIPRTNQIAVPTTPGR